LVTADAPADQAPAGYNPTGLPVARNVTGHFAAKAAPPDAGRGIYQHIPSPTRGSKSSSSTPTTGTG
jgi:hypothetical protein